MTNSIDIGMVPDMVLSFFSSGTAFLDPAFVLLIALGLDVVLGDFNRLLFIIPHPVVLIGRTIGWAEIRLNRAYRSEQDRLVRGAFLTLGLIVVTATLGLVIHVLAQANLVFLCLEILLIYTLIAQRSLFDHVKAVADALEHGGLAAGREMVARIVGRDVQQLDESGVARAAIESCAENFSDGVVAPLFWTVLFGLPGLMVYKTVNTLDSMIGYRSPRYLYFGRFAARLDDVLNWIPARLSGLTLVLASRLTAKGNARQALITIKNDARRHPSPNSGWPEAAMAGALGLALGGPRSYGSAPAEGQWIGKGRTVAVTADVRHALSLYIIACLINAALAVGVLAVV